MLITPKSQRQLCHCVPSQDTVPSQPKAHQGASPPARDVHPCPEPGSREHRHAGGKRDRRCPSGGCFRRTSVTQRPQQGAAGCTWGAGGGAQQDCFPLCTSSPASSEQGTICCCPQSCLSLSHRVPRGRQGQQGNVHFCRKSWWGRGSARQLLSGKSHPGP